MASISGPTSTSTSTGVIPGLSLEATTKGGAGGSISAKPAMDEMDFLAGKMGGAQVTVYRSASFREEKGATSDAKVTVIARQTLLGSIKGK